MAKKGKTLGKRKDLVLTAVQHDKLGRYTKGQGGLQNLCRKLHDDAKLQPDGSWVVTVYTVDLDHIRSWIDRPDSGGWQDLLREIMVANP